MAFRILEDFSDATSINSSDTSTIKVSSEHKQVGEFSDTEGEIKQMYTVNPCHFKPVASKELSYGIDSDSEEDSNKAGY